jgi:glycerophosphoryl diester phosphodiesterase
LYRDLDWLTARPFAHRGLHDGSLLENTIDAAAAAAAAGYGIECDIQLAADEEIMVFHDDALDRLTVAHGPLAAKTSAELRKIPFRTSGGHIPNLREFLSNIAGRVPLLIELKSRWDGDTRLAARAVAALAGYAGPHALMSFDPGLVHAVRSLAPDLPRGIVAERHYDEPEWVNATPGQKFRLGNLIHIPRTKPHFVAYWVRDLPALAPI